VIFGAAPAVALDFPALTGRVVDAADVIEPAAEAAIVAKLAAHETASSDQVVVATLPSLEGEGLEDFANRLFRSWQLGQAGENNGVLLLVAVNDRKIRIEVGYGLEGILTDALSRLVIENSMVPVFRAGDYGLGVDAGVTDILSILSGDAAGVEDRARRLLDTPPSGLEEALNTLFVALVFLIFFLSFLFAILAPLFGEKIGKNTYRWLGVTMTAGQSSGSADSGRSGWSPGSSGGGFSGGGGSSGGGGASGGW